MTSQSELIFNYCPTGGGAVFGPFFIRNRPFNAAEYLRLLAHAEHLVNLLMKSQLPRSITREVGLLELFPWSFWGEEQFGTVLVLKLFSFLVVFGGGTALRFPYRAGT